MKKIMLFAILFAISIPIAANTQSGKPNGWHNLYNEVNNPEGAYDSYLKINFSQVSKIPLFQILLVKTKSDIFLYNTQIAKEEDKLERLRDYFIDCKNWKYSVENNYVTDILTNKKFYNITYENEKNKQIKEYSINSNDKITNYDDYKFINTINAINTYSKDSQNEFSEYEKRLQASNLLSKNFDIQKDTDEEIIARAVCTPRYGIKKSNLQDYQCYCGNIESPINNQFEFNFNGCWCGNNTIENLKKEFEEYYKEQAKNEYESDMEYHCGVCNDKKKLQTAIKDDGTELWNKICSVDCKKYAIYKNSVE